MPVMPEVLSKDSCTFTAATAQRGGLDQWRPSLHVVKTWRFVQNELSKEWQRRQRHLLGSKSKSLIEVKKPLMWVRNRWSVWAGGRGGRQRGDRWAECVYVCTYVYYQLGRDRHCFSVWRELKNASHGWMCQHGPWLVWDKRKWAGKHTVGKKHCKNTGGREIC